MIVGGGKPALPAGFRTHLELLDEHRFNTASYASSTAAPHDRP
jgi:hypothetical protein